jgi:hypothetical protein
MKADHGRIGTQSDELVGIAGTVAKDVTRE